MNPTPPLPENFTDYERFAVRFYNEVDQLVTTRETPSLYNHIESRFCKIALTREELDLVGPRLEEYAIDAPDSATVTILGFNPYDGEHDQRGTVELTTTHRGTLGEDVTTTYAVCLDRQYDTPVDAFKDVRTPTAMYFDRARIDHDEQRALRAVVRMLIDL